VDGAAQGQGPTAGASGTAPGGGAGGLELHAVSHVYDGRPALTDVTLSVAPGAVLCLLGPSGCGKSTLLRLTAGIERLQAGRVVIGGRTVADARRALPPEARDVGMVFQDYALFPHLTVLDNVAFGLRRLPAPSAAGGRCGRWRASTSPIAPPATPTSSAAGSSSASPSPARCRPGRR
jgi:iron(III) transport system ATP-binding protein